MQGPRMEAMDPDNGAPNEGHESAKESTPLELNDRSGVVCDPQTSPPVSQGFRASEALTTPFITSSVAGPGWSPRARFFVAGCYAALSILAFGLALSQPGEEPIKLVVVLSASLSIVGLIGEIARLGSTRRLISSPFALLPLLGTASVAGAAFVAALAGEGGALTPLLAAAPVLAAATLFLGNAWAIKGLNSFRGDSDPLFPRPRRETNVRLGDVVQIKAGDVVSIDGRIQQGCVALDERSFSTVSSFRIKEEEDVVFAGSEIISGSASVVALSSSTDSSLNRLQEGVLPLLSAAQNSLEGEDVRASRWSALFILFLAIAAGIFWHERTPGYTQALLAGGTVALFGSACLVSLLLYGLRKSLVQSWLERGYLLATPTSCKDLAAISKVECDASRCAEGSYLQAVAFDVLDDRLAEVALCDFICALVGRAEDLRLVAVAEYCRQHGKSPSIERVVDMREYLGRGIFGTVHGVELTVGSEDFLVERGIMVQPSDGSGGGISEGGTSGGSGDSIFLVAIDDDVVARIRVISDQSDVVSSDKQTEWSGGVGVELALGVTRNLSDQTLLIRGRESDLIGQVARSEVSLFNPSEGEIRRATVVAFSPEIEPIQELLRDCRVNTRAVDRFRLAVGFGGLMVLAASFAGATTPLVPLLVLAFVGLVVDLSHHRRFE